MNFCDMDEGAMLQALKDAKCSADTMNRFLQLWNEQRWEEAARLLSCHRCHLICAMHEAQKPVDILDYILHQMEKKLL